MSRSLNSTINTAIASSSLEIFFAVDLLFDGSNALYLWTGLGNININSNTYVGVGDLLSISGITETADLSAQGISLSLSGIDSTSGSIYDKALTTPYQGRVCNLYFGIVGSESDMIEVFTGYMDTMNIEEGPTSTTIEVTVESKFVDLERPRWRKYTDAYQKSVYPSDQGFEYVAGLQEQRLPWGKGGANGTSGGGQGEGGEGAPVGPRDPGTNWARK